MAPTDVLYWNCGCFGICDYLKKDETFAGKPAPFVMELPQYHIPQAKTVLPCVERLKGFIIKAGNYFVPGVW